MNTRFSDGWFRRRMMRLTPFEKWAVNNPCHAQHTVQTALTLLEYVDLPPQPSCLEIGCGQGALTRLLVERYGARMTASDHDPAQVAMAQERLADLEGRVEFRVVDGRAMPFEDTYFDAVFSFGVLHHIPGGWRQVIAESARILKPNGWFVFTDFVLPPRTGRWLRRLLPRLDQLEETALHNCLAENGLHLEHYEYGRAILAGLMRYCIGVAHLTFAEPTL
ncbi:MAG: class I SAM-dependent methyltransferase [Anaerolineae bacterium]|nr:class I SAM-dependent methyltransferase [Anaerolineae bacterium]